MNNKTVKEKRVAIKVTEMVAGYGERCDTEPC